jgi:hypothetical protein
MKYDLEVPSRLAIVTLRLLSKGATMTELNDGPAPVEGLDPDVVVSLEPEPEPEPGPDEPAEPAEEPGEPAEEPEEPAEPAEPAEPTERPAARPTMW